MREIEFRAKKLAENDWVYGDLVKNNELDYLIFNSQEGYYDTFLVLKETIGQYTGLTDKNGNKIFEGDILIGDVPELHYSQNLIGIVEYQESSFIVKFPNRESWQIQKVGFCSFINYKVIGNIYDNPELLKN